MKEDIFKELESTSTENEIELVFSKNKVHGAGKKLKILQECQNLQSFYTPNYNDLTDEEKYAYELEIFLQGDWKKNKLYSKMEL